MTTWAYGITTVLSRIDTTLPETLTSLTIAGFECPRLFVDGAETAAPWRHFGLEVTTRWPAVRSFGNWMLALLELWIRDPTADRYAIFQDDVIAVRNLRAYLDACEYPVDGYWNLYTNPKGQRRSLAKAPGWNKSCQRGYGALALVFDADMARSLLEHDHTVNRFRRAPERAWQAIDGAVVGASKKMQRFEYVHVPSLVQHIGHETTMLDRGYRVAPSFPGEEFDALTLCREARDECRETGDEARDPDSVALCGG